MLCQMYFCHMYHLPACADSVFVFFPLEKGSFSFNGFAVLVRILVHVLLRCFLVQIVVIFTKGLFTNKSPFRPRNSGNKGKNFL